MAPCCRKASSPNVRSWRQSAVGRLAVQSVFVRDYPVVQAGVFVLALTFVAINLLVDLLYGVLDPRIRRE